MYITDDDAFAKLYGTKKFRQEEENGRKFSQIELSKAVIRKMFYQCRHQGLGTRSNILSFFSEKKLVVTKRQIL